jgi:molecular chaperone GrpE (heat shock protein)
MKTKEEIFNKHFYHSHDKEVIFEMMDEHTSQQTAEKDREIKHLKDSYQTLDNYFDETKQRLQKELSDFKALVKEKRQLEKTGIPFDKVDRFKELGDQVDKYLQE